MERCVLEDFTPCSKSHLWKLMMSFYDRKGPDSWSQGIVPHFITCNTFIAKSYVKVLHGWIQDCLRPNAVMPLDINEPLYIVELGAGSGKFSYFMLKYLEEMQNTCDFPLQKIKFIMTDFTASNFQFWQNHSALKPYFDKGILDAGIFDAVNDHEIKLWKAGTSLTTGSSKNPVVIVANYLFDTLYHDIFQIDHGELREGLISVGSKHGEEPDPLDPEIIQRLDNHYKYLPITTDYYKEEEGDEQHLQKIFDWYCHNFNASQASILFPIGAMRALRRLSKFSNNRLLVISGDKGNNNPDQFVGFMDPHIAVHGSFSLMVNYHAIGAYFTSKGGFTLHNPQEEASLKVSTFILCPETIYQNHELTEKHIEFFGNGLTLLDEKRSEMFPYLKQSFHDFIDCFGPNDFFVLQKSLKEDLSNPPLRTIVSLLKLSDWDPDVFFKFRDAILIHAPTCGSKLRNDLARGIPHIWNNHYSLDVDKDIAFEIGRFYYGIRDYEHALQFYKESISTVGEHHVTYHNQGLCYYSLGKPLIALEHFQKALTMSPEYEKARNWIEKVQNELNPTRKLEKDKEYMRGSSEDNENPNRTMELNLPLIRNGRVFSTVATANELNNSNSNGNGGLLNNATSRLIPIPPPLSASDVSSTENDSTSTVPPPASN
jgi:tetratricopeptide (TPR) repeat protein